MELFLIPESVDRGPINLHFKLTKDPDDLDVGLQGVATRECNAKGDETGVLCYFVLQLTSPAFCMEKRQKPPDLSAF